MSEVSQTPSRSPIRLTSPARQCQERRTRDVQRLIQSFNTWSFKREQPSDIALLAKFATRAVLKQEPLSFVLYWGKGPRSELAAPDIECLDYLNSLVGRISQVYARGASLNLVLTDTHAILNGHTAQAITQYFTGVEREATKRGFHSFLLGELTQAAGPFPIAEQLLLPSDETLRRLTCSAMRWYRGDGTAEQGARRYYLMNMVEKRVIELFFPSSIFATFNGSEQRELFPDSLPIFYMYSLRKGNSVKPWFLPAPAVESTVPG